MNYIGLLAMIASLMTVTLGMPAQIFKNFRRKNCEGLSPYLIYCRLLYLYPLGHIWLDETGLVFGCLSNTRIRFGDYFALSNYLLS